MQVAETKLWAYQTPLCMCAFWGKASNSSTQCIAASPLKFRTLATFGAQTDLWDMKRKKFQQLLNMPTSCTTQGRVYYSIHVHWCLRLIHFAVARWDRRQERHFGRFEALGMRRIHSSRRKRERIETFLQHHRLPPGVRLQEGATTHALVIRPGHQNSLLHRSACWLLIAIL